MITVRDRRLSIQTRTSAEREERVLRITNVEEQDHGLYRCVRGDTTLNEILLDVLSKSISSIRAHTHTHLAREAVQCTGMFVLDHIPVLIVSRRSFRQRKHMAEVCVLTDLLSCWMLSLCLRTKTIRLLGLHLDLLCVRMYVIPPSPGTIASLNSRSQTDRDATTTKKERRSASTFANVRHDIRRLNAASLQLPPIDRFSSRCQLPNL